MTVKGAHCREKERVPRDATELRIEVSKRRSEIVALLGLTMHPSGVCMQATPPSLLQIAECTRFFDTCSQPDISSTSFEMDPLSITAATIGITAFALTSIKQLRDTINDVADVKEVIHDISISLTDILVPLDSLRDAHVPGSSISASAKADLEKAGVAKAVNRCGDLCDDFAKRLEKWTKHSSGSKLSFRDRLTVSFNKEKIRTLRISVDTCQSTVQLAVQTTQL